MNATNIALAGGQAGGRADGWTDGCMDTQTDGNAMAILRLT